MCQVCLQSPYILAMCHVESVVSHVFTDDCNNHVLQCKRDAFPWYYWPTRKHYIRFVCLAATNIINHHHHHTITTTIIATTTIFTDITITLTTSPPLPSLFPPPLFTYHRYHYQLRRCRICFASTSDGTFLEYSQR